MRKILDGTRYVTALLTADGKIVASYYYDAFGTVLEKNENKGNNNPYRYAGYVLHMVVLGVKQRMRLMLSKINMG